MVKHNKWQQVTIENCQNMTAPKKTGKEYERIERLELYFTANDIDDEEKRKAILLTSCGIECYRLFKGLTSPRKPVDKTFIELVTLITNHENSKKIQLPKDLFSTCITENWVKAFHSIWRN